MNLSKIAKDAKKRPFAVHLQFSDICDNLTAPNFLWGFFILGSVKQLFLYKCNFLGGGRILEEENVEKLDFPIALKQ